MTFRKKTIWEVPFHSGKEIILDAADFYKMYDRIVDTIEERLWSFTLIASLEIHTYEIPDEPIILEESESDLMGFERQYTIRCGRGLNVRDDPVTFMHRVEELITNRLEITRKTMVKMVLKCNMQRTNTATGEKTIVEVPFHSGVEKNLANSDVHDIYDKMTHRRGYIDNHSLWSTASLEIHTYEIPRGSIPLDLDASDVDIYDIYGS